MWLGPERKDGDDEGGIEGDGLGCEWEDCKNIKVMDGAAGTECCSRENGICKKW